MRVVRGYWPLVIGVVIAAVVIVAAPSRGPDEVSAKAAATAGTEGQSATGWDETVTACPGGGPQVEGDPYSPPCFAFEGDNGGETSKGVTADEITVSYRQTAEGNVLTLLASLMGIPFDETAEDFLRTTEGLVDYFNESFQMYGRKIVLEPFDGAGTMTTEQSLVRLQA